MEKRTDIDIEALKAKLEQEKKELEEQLSSLGHRNPDNPQDWEPSVSEDNATSADPNERADHFEEAEDRAAILNQIEAQYDEVLKALKKIEEGTYGFCEVDGSPIEKERLEVNPSSRTCLKHIKK